MKTISKKIILLFGITIAFLIHQPLFSQVTQEWVSRYNSPGSSTDYAKSSAADKYGNVYVTGSSKGYEVSEDYVTIKYNPEGVRQWVARYNGPANSDDFANSIALDSSGNIYVTGLSYGTGLQSDYATIKYNSAGFQQWVARYRGPTSTSFNNAASIAVDYSGNVYVTGLSTRSSGDLSDYATIKYNSAGDSLWVKRYNGPGNSYDYATSIDIDNSGNVYVTGSSYGNGTQSDYATIKYNSSGTEQWVERYNGPGNSDDEANSIAADNSGNVFVTGSINNGISGLDYATIKYNSAGDSVWVRKFSGPGNSWDEAYSLTIDHVGNVLVTGVSDGGFGSTSLDYLTIKYNPAGTELWTSRYNGLGNSFDYAYSIAADGSGNVYVTGESFGIGTMKDYATVKYNSDGVQQWVSRYNGPGNTYDAAGSIAVDNSGNVYVTGESGDNGTYSDVVSIKYSTSGDSLWVARYNGPGSSSDIPTSMAVDGTGNIYVTGYSGDASSGDYLTIKINSAGNTVWSASYTTPEYFPDIANSIAVDKFGNVYVTGESYGGGFNPSDFVTIKYNSAGVQQWIKRYDDGSEDIARLVSVDSLGNIFVSGVSGGDYATIKYNSAGDSLWVRRYNGPGNYNDKVNSMVIDKSGNVYVTGGSDGNGTFSDYATIKYNSDGMQQWAARFNGPTNLFDIAYSIGVDDSGNVYVTGESTGFVSGTDYATVKYNSEGVEQWIRRYTGTEYTEDRATSLSVDSTGNVFVTGISKVSSINTDYVTIKYDTEGTQQWISIYEENVVSRNEANSISIDKFGNAYVTGKSSINFTDYDYTTIKYDSSGIQKWIEKYNGPGNSNDEAVSIILDNSGYVYVAGASIGNGTNWDFATIKYSQSTGIEQTSSSLPEKFNLSQNYPNPFNPNTKINYELPASPSGGRVTSYAELLVYDVLGKEVAILVNEKQSPGKYKVEFDGSGLPSGVYFYRLTAGEFTDVKRMMLVK